MSHALHFLVLTVAGWLQRVWKHKIEYLLAENALYRQRVGRSQLRLTDAQRGRLAIKAKAVSRKELMRIATIATPDTILRWYRRLVAQKYDGSHKREPGRPRVRRDIAELIVRLATENPLGLHAHPGRTLAARPVCWAFDHRTRACRMASLRRLNAADARPGEHLRAHWGAIAAMDFFTVEVLTRLGGLLNHYERAAA